ncbi:MAG TPA: hypothetical protein DCS93_23245 [Microscillaceae bacterium]|nr:hypothetical protein [Microscillaceae bacterium]
MRRIVICLLFCLVTLYTAQAQQGPFHFAQDVTTKNYVAGMIVYKLKPNATQAPTYGRNTTLSYQQPKVLADLKANSPVEMYPHGLLPRTSANKAELAPNELASNGLSQLSGIYTIQVPLAMDLEKAITLLRQQPNVVYAEPMYRYQSLKIPNRKPFLTPNDPQLSSQTYLDKIKAKEAWDVQTGDPSMIIGVVDFGFDIDVSTNYVHTDLRTNFAGALDIGNFPTTDNNLRYTGDQDSHGTEAVGITSATPNNGENIAGIAYNCRYIAIKANNDANTTFFGLNGVSNAAIDGAKVINMSWGRPGDPSQFEHDFLRAIVEKYDVVLVGAAGQDVTSFTTGTERYWYPASYSDIVLSVTSTDENDHRFAPVDYNEKVGIIAPGKDIFTLKNNGGTGTASGTSFSAPMAAAAAALVRVQYPSLNAAQVIARLRATANANAIYGLAANSAYVEKLGSGLLDVQKAVTEANPKFLSLESHTRNTTAAAGTTTQIICNFKNQLTAITNLQVELSSTSPLVNITQNTATLGAVATQEVTGNVAAPFVVNIDAGTAANTRVLFTLTFKDGATTLHTLSFYETLNPSTSTDKRADLNINELKLTLNDVGRLAVYNSPDASQSLALGLNYKGETILDEAGLMIGLNSTQVSNSVVSTDGSATLTRDSKFTSKLSSLQYLTNNDTLQDITVSYEDITDNTERIQVEVLQRTRAWKGTNKNNFVIVEYKIRNISGATINNLYAGIFADWNINDPDENTVNWDATNGFGYAFDKGQNIYAGVKLLTSQAKTHYAIENKSSIDININNDFTTGEKFTTLSNTDLTQHSIVTEKDVSHVVGAHLTNIANNETRLVAFAVMAADNLTALQQVATDANAQFLIAKTGPTPAISNVSVCKGSSVSLTPTNGNNFDFFADASKSILLFNGRSLALNNITVNDTFYVVNRDSLQASAAKQVIVSLASSPTAQFGTNQTVFTNTAPVTFTDQSTAATQWEWDFGNGQTFVGQTPPAQTYTTAGNYQVKLKVTSAGGCVDSLVKTLNVIDCNAWNDAIVMRTDTLDIGTTDTLSFSNTATSAVAYQWDFGNGNTSTLANPLQLFTQTGSFNITLTTHNTQGCSATTQRTLVVINSFVVGVAEQLKQQIGLFPNPGKQQFQLKLPALPAQAELQLTNLQGQVVFEKTGLPRSKQSIFLNLPKLPAGVYLFQVKWGDDSWTTRLVIQGD